jgi:hypothetical protein
VAVKIIRIVAAACTAAALMIGGAASAANYVESISANPASLSCNISNGKETCSAFTVFAAAQPPGGSGQYDGGSGFVSGESGDNVTIDVGYSSTVTVPNSKTISLVNVQLFAFNDAIGYYVPSEESTVSSVLIDYTGPNDPILAYESTSYTASAGHYFGGGNPGGFSIDGMDSSFVIVQGNPDLIVAADYSYQFGVPEPAAWALMLLGFGGVGVTMRARRKVAAPTA